MSEKGNRERPLGARLGEGIFCIIYLIFMVVLICIMKERHDMYLDLSKRETLNPVFAHVYRFGFGVLMAGLLVGGDAFHLIPRVIDDFTGKLPKKEMLLGIGSLISSITMTLFYNVLIRMGDSMEYSPSEYNRSIELWILILTFIRIFILLLPWNRWFSREPNRVWALLRNIPFAIIGMLTLIGFANVSRHARYYPPQFYMIIMILVFFSFLFYMPVALYGKEKPKLGMLMMPKTVCYIIMMSVICFY